MSCAEVIEFMHSIQQTSDGFYYIISFIIITALIMSLVFSDEFIVFTLAASAVLKLDLKMKN